VIYYEALLIGLELIACVIEAVVVVDLLGAAAIRAVPCAIVAKPGGEV
jgi:hypothetical protein